MIKAPQRDYPTIEAPEPIAWRRPWPIPTPETIRARMREPLRGYWIDHVPNGAEIAAMDLLRIEPEERCCKHPLATGTWGENWITAEHPEEMSPQMVMPDAWFNHALARQPPPASRTYTPKQGNTVKAAIGTGLCGSGYKHDAERLPELWRRGLLRSAHERMLANVVLRNIGICPLSAWYQLILDEGWTMRRAAQVLREAGIWMGTVCAWTNRWARAPAGAPAARSGTAETAYAIAARCEHQLGPSGAWPLAQTEDIAKAGNYARVE